MLLTMSLPDAILQEVRTLLAVQCREILMATKPDGEDGEGQKDFMFKSFHGTENHQSALDLFMRGSGTCINAFDAAEIEVNRAGNESRGSHGHMLVLKELLHRDPAGKYCVHDPGFARDAIANDKNGPIAGRTLHEKALKCIANYKHALKHYTVYADVHGNDPSGLKLPDMLLYVLRQMHVEFKGCKDKPTGKAAKNKGAFNEEDMPEKYTFNGFVTFAMFGPMPMSGETWSCFSVDGENVKKSSRNENRELQAKMADAERNAGSGGCVPEAYRRGVSLVHKASAAQLACDEHSALAKNLRDLLASLGNEARHTLDEHKMVSANLKEAREHANEDEEAYLMSWKKDLEDDMQDLRKRKRACEKELKDHLMKKPKPMESFCDQVGSFQQSNGSTSGNSSSVAAAAATGDGCTTPSVRPMSQVTVTSVRDDASMLTGAADAENITGV